MKNGSFKIYAISFILITVLALSVEAQSLLDQDAGLKSLGTVSIGFKGFMSSAIEQNNAELLLEPNENLVVVKFKLQSVFYRLYLAEKARLLLIEAIVRYNEEYDARTLNLRETRPNKNFGSADAKLEWGGITLDKYSYPKLNYGYVFEDRKKPRPYFTVTIPSATNLGHQVDSVVTDDNSARMVFYFTKVKATELGELLMPEHLQDMLSSPDPHGPSETAMDAY